MDKLKRGDFTLDFIAGQGWNWECRACPKFIYRGRDNTSNSRVNQALDKHKATIRHITNTVLIALANEGKT